MPYCIFNFQTAREAKLPARISAFTRVFDALWLARFAPRQSMIARILCRGPGQARLPFPSGCEGMARQGALP